MIPAPHREVSILDSRVDRYFAGGDLLVDLGCGDGAWIASVGSRYARAVGIDISAGAIASPGGSIETWEFLQRDLNKGSLPFPDGCADGVRANQVIEHVANPLHFVAESFRVLRPGGVFVATTPNVRYLRHVLRLVITGRGPLTSGGALRTPQVWDDRHSRLRQTRPRQDQAAGDRQGLPSRKRHGRCMEMTTCRSNYRVAKRSRSPDSTLSRGIGS